MTQIYQKKPLLSLFLAAILFLATNSYVFGASVSGSYRSVSNNSVVFDIKVGRPAPSSLIIQHFHPAALRITAASPSASKINARSGVAKWFLKNPQTGRHTFSINFSGTPSAAALRVVVRYKDPSTGTFQEISITP